MSTDNKNTDPGVLEFDDFPMSEDTGERKSFSDPWMLPTDGGMVRVPGTFIGIGSTEQDDHNHPGETYAAPKTRCGACRWFEMRIFVVAGKDAALLNDVQRPYYVVHTTGASVVPEERHRFKATSYYEPGALINSCVMRKEVPVGSTPGETKVVTFLTTPAKVALEQAVNYSQELFDAWNVRPVR